MSKALKTAIEQNDPEAVRKSAKKIKDLNRKLFIGVTPFAYACKVGAHQVLDALLELGAIGEPKDIFAAEAPIAIAAARGRTEVIRRLLELNAASAEAISFALGEACYGDHFDTLELLLSMAKPSIPINVYRLAAAKASAGTILKILLKHERNVNIRINHPEATDFTLLHELISSGRSEVAKVLVEHGYNVNARDSLGRTPLMMLAASLERIDMTNQTALIRLESLERRESQLLAGERPSVVNALGTIETLLELGADPIQVDFEGNDAMDYCLFGYFSNRSLPPEEHLATLREAGAQGDSATFDLIQGIAKNDLEKVRSAIAAGATVNKIVPSPSLFTPLEAAAAKQDSVGTALVELLLLAGANPEKSSNDGGPLIHAARAGNLPSVQRLIEAGADIHAVHETEAYLENAFTVAEGEVKDFLRSRGATKPRYSQPKLFEAGVGGFDDFDEILIKSGVEHVANFLATIINGKSELDAYDKSFSVGKRAYVVAQPKGMNWANIFQIAPPRARRDDPLAREAFALDLAKGCHAPVLLLGYSDTSHAASIVRIDPDGKITDDSKCDFDLLKELVEAEGTEAPAWARKEIAKRDENESTSVERLSALAKHEKFVVGSFGFYHQPNQPIELGVRGYEREAFENVAFVNSGSLRS